MAAQKKAVAPVQSTVLVLCDHDHVLDGLFLVFRAVVTPPEAKAAKIMRLFKGSSPPGAPPVAPVPEPPPAEGTPEPAPKVVKAKKKAAAENQAKYERAKTQYDKSVAKYRDEEAAWRKKMDVGEDLPPDPADRFVCGFVDSKGFLQPVDEDHNPWKDAATGRNPDSYKLAIGEKYDVLGIRHPDPELARVVARHLNRETSPADVDYLWMVYGWGDIEELLKQVEVKKVTREGKDQGAIHLSESPQDYRPLGGDAFDGWTLYRDMPHGKCANLPDLVWALGMQMGKLHFPIGGTGSPYESKPLIPPKKRSEKPIPRSSFDGQLQAAVARLHEVAGEGRAVVLGKWKAKAQDEGRHWYHVLARPYDAATDSDLAWRSLDPHETPLGLVDANTAELIQHWIDKGLAKPFEHLLPVDDWNWMLARGASAFVIWDLVAKAFGVACGVKPGSTIRSVLVGAWPGAINNSIHKTGLAVDLAGGGDRDVTRDWPVRYEASWKERPTKAQVALEKLKASAKKRPADTALQAAVEEAQRVVDAEAPRLAGRQQWTQKWRIYGPSSLAVYRAADPVAVIGELRGRLSRLLGVDVDGTVDVRRGELFAQLRKRFFADDPDEAVATWIEARLTVAPPSSSWQPVASYLQDLIALPDSEILARYFRRRVVQWAPNAYEADGGSNGKPFAPDEGNDDFPATPGARSWVNLSAIGNACEMERIGPHTSDVRDRAWILGPNDPKAAAKPFAMARFLLPVNDEGKDNIEDDESIDIAVMLHDITRKGVQNVRAEMPVRLMRDDAEVASYLPEELDGDFVKAWRDRCAKLAPGIRPTVSAQEPTDARGAQIAVLLSAGEGQAAVEEVAGVLEKFGARHFVVVFAGSHLRLDGDSTDTAVPRTGSDLAASLRSAQKRFLAEALVAKAKPPATTPEVKKTDDKPVKSKKELEKEKAIADAAAEKVARSARTAIIQPCFLKKPKKGELHFLPEESVMLPPGSNANHLEWWHYQHRSANEWGPLLEECGYSLEVMATPIAGSGSRDAAPVHRGLGYKASDMTSKPGAGDEATVENWDDYASDMVP